MSELINVKDKAPLMSITNSLSLGSWLLQQTRMGKKNIMTGGSLTLKQGTS